MEKFIKNHPRLYWLIVATIAILAFAVVTCVGLGKLEKAEASVMSPERAEQLAYSAYVKAMGNSDVGQYPYNTVVRASSSRYYVFYTQSPMYVIDAPPANPGNRQYAYRLVSDDYCYLFYVNVDETVTNATSDSNRWVQFDDLGIVVYSNYSVWYGNVPVRVLKQYSFEAPYVKYERVEVVNNLIADKTYIVAGNDIVEDFQKTSKWTYRGVLENIGENDTKYTLNMRFYVDLPTWEYVYSLWEEHGYSLSIGWNILKHNRDIVNYWWNDNEADYRTVEFTYPVEIAPDENGRFEVSFDFEELETVMRYMNSDIQEEFKTYGDLRRAILMSYAHIDKVVMDVETEQSGSVVYGRITAYKFERGKYDVCVESFTDGDKGFVDSELLDRWIDSDLQVAYKDYLKDLEQKVEDLQGQVDSMTGTLGNFDSDFDGNTLWGAVRSLGSGLLGMSGFITSFAVVLGSFFVFLPYDVQACVGYLFIIALVVVLWRLLKK